MILPRVYCFDIKTGNLEKLIEMFKNYLIHATSYINDTGKINFNALQILMKSISKFEIEFMSDKLDS